MICVKKKKKLLCVGICKILLWHQWLMVFTNMDHQLAQAHTLLQFHKLLLLAHPNCCKPVCCTVFALRQTMAAVVRVATYGSIMPVPKSGAVEPQILRKGWKQHGNNATPKEQRFLFVLRTLSFPVVCLKPRIEQLWGCGSNNAVVSVLH